MLRFIRLAVLSALLVIPSVADAYCPEVHDIVCGEECVGAIEGGHCALVVSSGGGQTSETSACIEISGGCASHDDDCHCGGSGSF